MKTLLSLASAALLLAAPSFLSPHSVGARGQVGATQKPNIVLIFIDDMGYGDIGPFGSTKNRTPNLDKMAREGMKLTSFYAAPVCSVSRAQVLTGCYGARVSIPGVFFPGEKNGLNKDEHTVAELLKDQGYATMCIGKWHLGDQPEFLPTRHGFDHYFGFPYSNDMLKKAKGGTQPVVPLLRDDKVIELLTGEEQSRLTERYTDEAIKFITDNQKKPFFLYLPHTAIHTPIHPGAQFRGKSANGRVGDWVEEVDWSVGRVRETLAKLGLDKNTLVIFTSDNGPWLTQGKDSGEAGPLRGGKGSTWEGGVREPTLVAWPGKIAPGSTSDAVAGTIDFLPTFVQLAGGTVPTDRKIDGKDIAPLLLGKTKQSPHEARYYFNGYQLQAVRSGPWKLAIAPQSEGMGKAGATVAASLESPRLYNLDTEIGERTDVAAAHPEIVTRLKALAVAMRAELGETVPGPGRRPAGEVKNPVTLYPFEESAQATSTKPATLDSLKVGDTLSGAQAPQVVNRPLTISCTLEGKPTSGVLVAHGGTSTGYALYLKDGHAVFAVHPSGGELVRLTSPRPLAENAVLEARIAADGALSLKVNGEVVATHKLSGPLSRQPQEPFCVGFDSANPVDSAYASLPRFAGTLRALKVSTKE
ncbi:sulfatase-like hydrolase/transferase [Armatimonas rosea]|uniref:Arylsulfatase A-like enzyme n=1 Tax=Armatimonas rosea TaxID=685828 RepID=A0A7W9SQF0_ARMRO|nr:sulfatase-like hydrolase/transferase [Armatimonas rosea]MBB6050113.1 arylsulfatase A-like enzyme [Armatimonas rosea]